jgi:hypothetical protein
MDVTSSSSSSMPSSKKISKVIPKTPQNKKVSSTTASEERDSISDEQPKKRASLADLRQQMTPKSDIGVMMSSPESSQPRREQQQISMKVYILNMEIEESNDPIHMVVAENSYAV